MAVKVNGNINGLKPAQKKALEKLYERKVSQNQVITNELAKALCAVSKETGRQVGLLIDRRGRIFDVFVGDSKGIEISDFGRYRAGESRLRGLRFIHTHLSKTELNSDDLTDLALLRFDLIAVIEVLDSGLPGQIQLAHLLPFRIGGALYDVLPFLPFSELKLDFSHFIEALESEMNYSYSAKKTDDKTKRAILVHVSSKNPKEAFESVEELQSLAESAGVVVLDSIVQRRAVLDPRFVMGAGKIKELFIKSLELDANTIVFDGELSGSQMRSISDATELDVIDRTQMILDIFAKRAKSSEGKIQVELAQMKYSLPRFVLKDDFLSRITGGIRSRGPGETKMEILKRRVRERITFLEDEIKSIVKSREERRKKREKSSIPVVSIVGYTNAGKSTLLNSLTSSDTFTEDKLFATLDTASRRLRLFSGKDIILTDTVGFIKNIPEDLLSAFRATLEEMRDSDILIHLFDASSVNYDEQIKAVEQILTELALDNIPIILAGNKFDLISEEKKAEISEKFDCLMVSATRKENLNELMEAIQSFFHSHAELP